MDEQIRFERYQKIEAYCLGHLNEEERAAFEQELSTQPILREETDKFLGLFQNIQVLGLKNELSKIEGELEQEGFFLDENAIEDYFLGKLPKEQIPAFERKRKEDPIFAQKINEFEQLLGHLADVQREKEIKLSLKEVEKELELDQFFEPEPAPQVDTPLAPKRIKISWVYRMAIAAGFLLLVTLSVFIFQSTRLQRAGKLALSYSLPEKRFFDEIVTMVDSKGFLGSSTDNSLKLKDALQLYKNENYKQAYVAFQSYLHQYPNSEIGQFYLGVSSLHVKDFSGAVIMLNKVLAIQPESRFRDDAEWFLSMAEIRTNPEKGKARLKKIAQNDESDFREIAQQLIKSYHL